MSRRSLALAPVLAVCVQLLLATAVAAVTGGADWPFR